MDNPTVSVKRIVGQTGTPAMIAGHTVGMANQTTLGSVIRDLRKKRGITQSVAAADIGIGRSTLASIEAGSDLPGRETLAAFASYFGVSIDYLLGGGVQASVGDSDTQVQSKLVEDIEQLTLLDLWEGMSLEMRRAVLILAKGARDSAPGVTDPDDVGRKRAGSAGASRHVDSLKK